MESETASKVRMTLPLFHNNSNVVEFDFRIQFTRWQREHPATGRPRWDREDETSLHQWEVSVENHLIHLARRSSESDGGGQRPHMTVQSPSQAPALPENHLDSIDHSKDNEITLHSDESNNDGEPGDFARRADERRKAGRAR
jgi:hypothetical protein